ncbi:MAG: hypothetical protein JST01_24000 [Cyanobacteria bacterium SZAS TMP-1]|nr:hypothetical protein [Cyanobacteria bacterium SZAS TMP-1]
MSTAEIKLLGIRHHGPGSARSVLSTLKSFRPDCILLEGPPEGDALIKYVRAEGLAPPVALLVYAQEHPRQACYYPFAEFSPEWQALTYAVKWGVTCRFMDLPQTNWLALSERKLEKLKEKSKAQEKNQPETEDVETVESDDFNAVPTRRESLVPTDGPKELTLKQQIRMDPIGALARSAGFSDGERWWEQLVEQRSSGDDIFEGINEAMAELRNELAEPDRLLVIQREDDSVEDEQLYEDLDERIEPLREAHMRQTLRAALKEGFQKIAIVCGAWHGPAFSNMPPAKNDIQLLKGLPKIKVEATWIPWTHGRLQFNSGYGAGVESPGWYQHIFKEKLTNAGHSHALSWLVKVAHLLREEQLDASSAQVIDAFRLAEAMASMRELTHAGLDELNEATVSVFCGGNLTPLSLIYKKLVVGERLGEVPAEIPGTPLQRDLIRQQTRLRLKPEASSKILELDLRKAFDLEKSELLHRLILLDIHWGEKQDLRTKTSTFHEQWELEWQPDLSIAVVEAGIWGRTIEQAASARAVDQTKNLTSFAALVKLLEQTIEASLPQALPGVMQKVDSEAATQADVNELLKALPTLAKIARYGNVRRTTHTIGAAHINEMIDAIVTRVCINLPAACSSLDDDAAALMDRLIADAYGAIYLLDKNEHKELMHATLAKLAEQEGLHGQIAGRATRLLFDCNYLSSEKTSVLMSHALGRSAQAAYSGQWLQGFLAGSGLVLIHDHKLFALIDAWLAQLNDEHFIETLPLLRRTFGQFTSPERLSIGEMAKNSRPADRRAATSSAGESEGGLVLNEERLAPVLATIGLIFGLEK